MRSQRVIRLSKEKCQKIRSSSKNKNLTIICEMFDGETKKLYDNKKQPPRRGGVEENYE